MNGGLGQTEPPNNTISIMTKQTEPLCYDCDVTSVIVNGHLLNN